MTNEQALALLDQALHHFSSLSGAGEEMTPLERTTLFGYLKQAGRLFSRFSAQAGQVMALPDALCLSLWQDFPDAIFYFGPKMKLVLCNQRAAGLYGADAPATMTGLQVANFFGRESEGWLRQYLQHPPPALVMEKKECLFFRRNGITVPAEVCACAVMNHRGKLLGLVCVVSDISRRKEMEQHLLHAERLGTLGRVSAELAHEIKNPLQSMQSSLELALDFDLTPEELQDNLRLCHQEVERLVDLTNNLLRQSMPPSRHAVSVDELFSRTIQMVERSSRRLGVEINTIIPDDFPLLWVETDQMLQVLLNLSINAIDAMPGGGQLTLSAEMEAGQVCLHVINDGNISPPGRLENIFEPFYTTKTTGTGLGLPISHHIIQRLGGNLQAANLHDPERVVFTISLPVGAFPGRDGEQV